MKSADFEVNGGGAAPLSRQDKGFTLAEVLITLALIGIVAAMTIPTLVSSYQTRAWNTSAQVFERKLEEALKTMNIQQTLAGYRSTADFVAELARHFKINKICNNTDIMSCFEDKVYWGKDELEVNVENVKTAAQLGQADWGTEAIGVQFANGTTGIIAYDPQCRENPYSNQFSGVSCIALLYDTSGFKTPNADGKDLRYLNVPELDGHKPCAVKLSDGTCFTKSVTYDALTVDECKALAAGGFGNDARYCLDNDDFWAGAVKACGGVDNLPDVSQLHTLGIELAEKNVSIEDVGLDSAREVYRFWAGYSGTEGDHARFCHLSLNGGPLCDHSPRANSGYNVLCVTN